MAKGSGPTESLRKVPKLTPELHKFIEGMGLYFASQGIPRIGGRMLGALMIAHWPLSPKDMASILHVSRASISNNLRLLLSTGMIERAHMPGSRHTHFAFSDEAMEQRVAAGVKSLRTFKRLLEQAAEAVPVRDPARHHIDASLQYTDVLMDVYEQAIERWKAHHPVRAHFHPEPAEAGA